MAFWTFVFAISIASIVAGVVTTWIRAKHGYPIDQAKESDGKTMQAICDENARLKKQVAELTERLVVLERIATDPAERVSREIEKLR
jgi:hypothetical protein